MPSYSNPFDILLAGGEDDTIENDPFRKLFKGGLPPSPTPAPTPTSPRYGSVAGAGGGGLGALLAALAPQNAPNTGGSGNLGDDLSKVLTTQSQLRDPVGYANKMTQLPSYYPGSQSPFNTGFFDEPRLTPEARLASQGPSAKTQWGMRGGVEGIDPEVLRKLIQPGV